jgi:hypothetical protein
MENWPSTGDRYDPYDLAHPMWQSSFWGRYTAGPAAPAAPAGPAALAAPAAPGRPQPAPAAESERVP